MAQSQISRDAKASARGAVIASGRGGGGGDGTLATNGGMPSDYQVCWCERGEGWNERERENVRGKEEKEGERGGSGGR
jgi:hypothetical protein